MHRSRQLQRLSSRLAARRSYATAASPHALVFIEHQAGAIESGSLAALTAATQLGGKVTGLIVGAPEEVKQGLDKAKRYVQSQVHPQSITSVFRLTRLISLAA